MGRRRDLTSRAPSSIDGPRSTTFQSQLAKSVCVRFFVCLPLGGESPSWYESNMSPSVTPPSSAMQHEDNAMDTDLTEAKRTKRRPKSFEHIWRPLVRPCAARIGGPENEIMSDPISRPPGWDLAKDGIDPKGVPNHYNSFTGRSIPQLVKLSVFHWVGITSSWQK